MYDFCEKTEWAKENKLLNIWQSNNSKLTQPTVSVLFGNQPYFIFHSSVELDKAILEVFSPHIQACSTRKFEDARQELSHSGFIARSTILVSSLGKIIIQRIRV